MHILFLSDNFPPEVNAPASRTFEHCREWVRAGHKVTVITCAPNFPGGQLFGGYKNKLWQSETVAGIRVIRVWSYITANEGFAKRILDYLSYMFTATIAGLFVRRVDVVVGTSPQFFTAVAAWLVAACKRVPWVFELRDIWPESIKAVGALRSAALLRALEALELFLYRASSRVVVVTQAFRDNLARRGIPANKIDVVTNGVDIGSFTPRPKDPTLEKSLDIGGKFVAGYIGTHGMAHGLEVLLDAAEILAKHPAGGQIVILLLGDGARKSELVTEAGARGLLNVRFVPTVPKKDVVNYWSLLDISIIHLRKTELFETVIPSKMFEAMAMGVPMLMGLTGEAAEIMRVAQAGETFAQENAEDLAEGILRWYANPSLRRKYAASALAAAPDFDRAVLAGKLLDVLEGVVSTRK